MSIKKTSTKGFFFKIWWVSRLKTSDHTLIEKCCKFFAYTNITNLFNTTKVLTTRPLYLELYNFIKHNSFNYDLMFKNKKSETDTINVFLHQNQTRYVFFSIQKLTRFFSNSKSDAVQKIFFEIWFLFSFADSDWKLISTVNVFTYLFQKIEVKDNVC